MTGQDLRRLRYGLRMNSAVRLAELIGVHPSTIYRNERRDRVTDYVADSVDVIPTAAAFLRGMMRERNNA